jgi:hypothetical protein
MNQSKRLLHARKLALIASVTAISLMMAARYFYAYGQDKSGFPDGFDAVQAPNSHKVIFENEFVRVLEVTMPAPGTTEPMHHHRWPSFFLDWDTGGGTPHHRPDGSVRDSPSTEEPTHPGTWSAHWMKPEPMHAIEVVGNPKNTSTLREGHPSLLRIEIKCHP